jgi:hypothetical protein
MNWISVNDRFPEDGQRVIVWNNKYGEVTLQVYNKEYQCWDSENGVIAEFGLDEECGNGVRIIEHWMLLPTKPSSDNTVQKETAPFGVGDTVWRKDLCTNEAVQTKIRSYQVAIMHDDTKCIVYHTEDDCHTVNIDGNPRSTDIFATKDECDSFPPLFDNSQD